MLWENFLFTESQTSFLNDISSWIEELEGNNNLNYDQANTVNYFGVGSTLKGQK